MQNRIKKLRKELKKLKINGLIVPRADKYLGEYIPPSAERLAYITGFTGSAGQAIITESDAIFTTDGRYKIQAQEQIDKKIFDIEILNNKKEKEEKLQKWVKKNIHAKDKIAIDPWLHSVDEVENLKNLISVAKAELVIVQTNLIDKIWTSPPKEQVKKAKTHPLEYSGKPHIEKITEIANLIKDSSAGAMVTTIPEEIAWLLNIRGEDVPNTPILLSFAIIDSCGEVSLFVDKNKITAEVKKHLGDKVKIHSSEQFEEKLSSCSKKSKILMDFARTPYAVKNILERAKAKIENKKSLIQLPKSRKNQIEIKGAVKAHIKDGVALSRFLYQLSKPEIVTSLTEITASDMLEKFRKEEKNFKSLSFDTISAVGSNGAIIHYKATKKTNRALSSSNIYLVDSGGQYLEGTTDVTRTIALGEVSNEVKDRFTRVLKGHIQTTLQIFEKGETGKKLDKISREPLMEIGLNYPHSLGHGVGSYLSVHEGPQSLSSMGQVELEESMIVSNEPGYYKEGEYGIRIENLILIEKLPKADSNKDLFKFKNLTLVPIDLRLVKNEMLSELERNWLNCYHREVREKLLPELKKKDKAAANWLKKATEPLPNPKAARHLRPNKNGGGKTI